MWLKQAYLSIGIHTAAPGTLLYRMHHRIALFYAKAVRRRLTTQYPLKMTGGSPHRLRVIYPSENRHLTKEEFNHCCSLVDYYTAEGVQILSYCKERGRNPDIYDRGNVWKNGHFVDAMCNMMLTRKYNNINRLRLIAWHFSGYRVFDLASGSWPPPNAWFERFYQNGLPELPDNVDIIINNAINVQERLELLIPRLNRLINNVDNKYLHSQPLRLGELAGEFRGFMVNVDSIRYWSTIAVMERSGIFAHLERKIAEKGYCRVIEIGAGYGGLAYQLKKTFGDKLQFIAVDLVESLLFSACYLTTLIKEKTLYYKDENEIGNCGLVFVPSFRSPEFFDVINDIDLCINTISMNEMSAAQVDYYGQMVSKTLANNGIFFECNMMAAKAGPERIEVKGYLALHFNDRLSIESTEMDGDGNLDLWSNNLPAEIEKACNLAYKDNVIHYKRASSNQKILA